MSSLLGLAAVLGSVEVDDEQLAWVLTENGIHIYSHLKIARAKHVARLDSDII
jgi:hypothetical protein